ncbi:MAG: WG repeat-containing protein [Candidatus Riflebacteria bacterium]|nr:WG repeat-containing protein [Candidatus Riflebacteria bacterium]
MENSSKRDNYVAEIIDIDGKHIATVPPVYGVPNFSENRGVIRKDRLYFPGYGLIDNLGKTICPPAFWLIDIRFSENLCPAMTWGKFGFINANGEWKIPPRYVFALPFSEGLAAVNSQKLLTN